nr:hypothetical protein BaRGS_026980 [Batillaria attramentaria]
MGGEEEGAPQADLEEELALRAARLRPDMGGGQDLRQGQNPAEEVGLDWTHPQEASIQHHTPSPDMKPAGEKEERPASQQLEAGH